MSSVPPHWPTVREHIGVGLGLVSSTQTCAVRGRVERDVKRNRVPNFIRPSKMTEPDSPGVDTNRFWRTTPSTRLLVRSAGLDPTPRLQAIPDGICDSRDRAQRSGHTRRLASGKTRNTDRSGNGCACRVNRRRADLGTNDRQSTLRRSSRLCRCRHTLAKYSTSEAQRCPDCN